AAATSSRLSGPNPPSAMPASWTPNAVTYPTARSARSNGRSTRPLGNARNTCRKRTAGRRSKTMPTVYGPARSAEERLDRNQVAPASTIRRPKRLSGLLHHATTPARMKPSIPQTCNPACTPGSRMWSLVRASSTVHTEAASPASTIVQSRTGLGARRLPATLGSTTAIVAMPHAPSWAEVTGPDGTSHSQPQYGRRERMEGGVSNEDTPVQPCGRPPAPVARGLEQAGQNERTHSRVVDDYSSLDSRPSG